MNYIRHLTTFYEKVASDDRLNSSHISLYMALFQFWNFNHFENPFSISRSELMTLSKIGSLNTYHKCLNELHGFGYLEYIPSHNPLKGSLVNLYNFDTSTVQVPYNSRRKIDTSTVQALRHSINNINVLNNKTFREENSQADNQENLKTQNPDFTLQKSKRKKVAVKKEKGFVPPTMVDVLSFFKSENFPELEAKKFFNYFQSNGWKVGGKAPMKDWNAAARNWMLNNNQYLNRTKPSSTGLNTDKKYDIPL